MYIYIYIGTGKFKKSSLFKICFIAATLYRLRRQNPKDFCICYAQIVFLAPGGVLGGSGGRSPPGEKKGLKDTRAHARKDGLNRVKQNLTRLRI